MEDDPTQEIQHEAVAVNIEVPVRVFSGGEIVDDLTIEDFELFEDGEPQTIDALYFVRHSKISRAESRDESSSEEISVRPSTRRHFVLIFQMMTYLPEVGDAVDYFFEEVLLDGDSLAVVTPEKTYRFREEALQRITPENIADQLKAKIRTDVWKAGFEYRALQKHLHDLLIQTGEEDYVIKNDMIISLLRRMKDHIYLDPAKVKNFAGYLSSLDGQKHVILLLQNELMPFPKAEFDKEDTSELDLLRVEMQQDFPMHLEDVRKFFSDSTIHFHFSYITRRENQILDITRQLSFEAQKIDLVEFKQELISVFKDIADTTGGVTDTSYNARASFRRAVEAVENYYLLFYTPKAYKPDGKFHTIEVKLKAGNYRLAHRRGYVAD
ncbi:MAG: hypothetical protein SCM96_07330 [Acidobacteriota bacterium]|nr:hypothetical protein [Acidobacteriota bacterium]